MARRCDKCRMEYESGSYYNGHDYCMTCYVRVKQDDERKRRAEELAKERREEEKRRMVADQLRREMEERRRAGQGTSAGAMGTLGYKADAYRQSIGYGSGFAAGTSWKHKGRMSAKDRREEERKKRDEAIDNLVSQIGRAAPQPDHRHSHHNWSVAIPHEKKKGGKGPQASAFKTTEEDEAVWSPDFRSHHLLRRGKVFQHEHKEGVATTPEEDEETTLILTVKCGLPVSLSIGQRQNRVILSGKNESPRKVNVELFASIADSKGKQVDAKIEPSKCSLDANADLDFAVTFDLPEDAARGALAFSAFLKENAMYIDREAGRSDILKLHANVKTPPDLKYRRGSAEFAESEGGLRLSLLFDNAGESGGILDTKSGVTYGEGAPLLTAPLSEKAKFKGLEKGVKLVFFAQKKAQLGRLAIYLVGVDSNGKPYKLQQIVEKKN